MLRKIRIILALVFFLGVTALFLDFTGTVHAWLGLMAKVQFLPAVLSLNLAVVVALVLLTLIFGRVYCSVICPLGVFQDIAAWFGGLGKGRKYRYSYSPALNWMRYGVFVLFIAALLAGIGSLVALLAPYSAWGRIVSSLFAPVYQLGNNLLANWAERAQSYAFYEKDVWIRSGITLGIAAATFVILIVLAWSNGRTYCNTVCPVGTVLGALSRFSLFGITIDKSKCNACGLCSRRCKASCIDGKNHRVDYSRCVSCLDCIDTCRHGAISYTRRSRKAVDEAKHDVDRGRRRFLVSGAMVASAAALHAKGKTVDGGLAVITDKKAPQRRTRIVPPGAMSIKNLSQHCTGCQLCVSVCPNDVLRPSAGLTTIMQPESSYELGYCRPECTRCSQVCPAGAIRPITPEEKTAISIGHAVWVRDNCIPITDGVECGNCARHCPVGAILMVSSDPSNPDAPKIPAVNTERCIGCGACENLCPSRPFSAIYVEGRERHASV